MRAGRARAVTLAGGLAALAVAAPAWGQTHAFVVAAQNVDTAIAELGQQGDVQIVGLHALLHGRRGHALRGEMGVAQALQVMLDGTGLVARQTAPRTWVVVEGPPPRPPAAKPPAPRHAPLHRLPPVAQAPVFAPPTIDPVAIVVTASRVIITGNTMPGPVTVLRAIDLQDIQPASVVAAMYELPAVTGSIGPTSNLTGGGLHGINLRGIGVNRALVLVDGRRAGPTGGNNTLNPDVVPQILLQRVDVVTGGVSADYGSDGVSGAVNFVTDTHFTGFKATIQNGVSTYGDDGKFAASAAWGARFAQGRGHVELGGEYRNAPGIESRMDRPFLADTLWSEQGSVPGGGAPGSASNPFVLTKGAVLGTASFGGLIASGPLAGLQFAQNGVLSAFTHGTPTGTPGIEVGGDGAYFVNSSLSAGQRIHNGYGRVDFDVSEHLHAYGSLAYTRFRQTYQGQNLYLSTVAMGYDNPFLATVQQPYRATIAAQAPGASFQMGEMVSALPNYSYAIEESYYQAAAGVDGRIANWRWNADYSHSDSRMTTTNATNINTARLYAALDAVTDSSGKTVCHAALVNPAYAGCVPLDIFGPSAENQAAIAYVEQATHATTAVWMDDVGAGARGDVLTLPTGPVTMGVSAGWRRLVYRAFSDALPDEAMDCTGIRFNCTGATTPWQGGTNAIRTPVSQVVGEGAVSVAVPLVKDRRWAQALGVEGAIRYADYSTSGGAWMWKASASWQVDGDLRLRATRSRDVRAPSLQDLYAPQTNTLKAYYDAHTATSGIASLIGEGNPDLTPERAMTWTLGAVWAPRRVPGLSVALDYYRIDIANAIASVVGTQPLSGALCDASGGTAAVCSLIQRPLPYADTSPANYPSALLAISMNVATVHTEGVDLEVNYATRLAGHGVSLRALANWQPHLVLDYGPGGIVDVGGAADGAPGLPMVPSVKLMASVAYDLTEATRLRVAERWRNAVRQNGASALSFADGKVPAIGYTDLSLTHGVNERLTAFLDVRNVFNAWPPAFASSGGSIQINYLGGYAQGDDIEGRYFTLGLRLKM